MFSVCRRYMPAAPSMFQSSIISASVLKYRLFWYSYSRYSIYKTIMLLVSSRTLLFSNSLFVSLLPVLSDPLRPFTLLNAVSAALVLMSLSSGFHFHTRISHSVILLKIFQMEVEHRRLFPRQPGTRDTRT